MTKFSRANKFNAKKSYRCLSCGAALPGKAAACMHCGESRVHTFDSRAEGRRYDALRLKMKAGFISGLRVHPSYEIIINGEVVSKYIADFEYVIPGSGLVIEDVKSPATRTPEYRLKKKCVEALYKIRITEVMR